MREVDLVRFSSFLVEGETYRMCSEERWGL